MESPKYRLFILGAGFSKAAGYPLAKELWQEILKQSYSFTGRARRFCDDLEYYIQFKKNCEGKDLPRDEIDFEDFMRFLDVEHFLKLRGSDTWSCDGNEGTVVVKTLMAKILADCTPEKIPSLYLDFVKKIQPGDVILTFNYDILLERALESIEKPYRLYPDRYKLGHDNKLVVDDSTKEVILLKMHGSINWFDRTFYSKLERKFQRHGSQESPSDLVFNNVEKFKVVKLLEGPRPQNNPLNEMYHVRNIKELYRRNTMFLTTPWMLSPSALKILYASRLLDFWDGMNDGGVHNRGLTIIGYSLPSQDEYAKQILYRLVTNYQTQYWDEDLYKGQKKSPLVIVDWFGNDDAKHDAFKERYRFVNWDRAVLHKTGFDQEAIDLIFQ